MWFYEDKKAMLKFKQDYESIKLAYRIGVFSYKYAINKIRILYAKTFGVYSGIYQELALCDFEQCLID